MDQPDQLVSRTLKEFSKRLEAFESRIARLEDCSKGQKNIGNSLWEQFAERVTSIVGLKEAVSSERQLIRISWLILLCLGITATLGILYQTNKEYLKDPIATRMKLVSDKDYKFPPMLLCPQQWFDITKAKALGLSRDGLLFSLSYFMDLYPLQVANFTSAEDEFQAVYAFHKFHSLLDFYKAISPDLVYRTSNSSGSMQQSHFTCRGCKAELTGKTILDHRFCYTFYWEPLQRGFGAYSSSRSVKLYLEANTGSLIEPSSDWQLYFNPFPDFMHSVFPMVTVHAFVRNTVMFEQQMFNMASTVAAPCHETDPKKEYSFGPCVAKCHNDLYEEKLGCRFLWLSDGHLPPRSHCNAMNKTQLPYQTLEQFFATDENANIDATAADICIKQCPPPCNRRFFDTSSRLHYSFPESEKRRLVKANMTGIEIHVKHGAVYQAGIMELSEVNTYTLTQLISNIGGSLGLFVGATLLTFAQAILFLVDYLCGNRKCGRTKKKTQSPVRSVSRDVARH